MNKITEKNGTVAVDDGTGITDFSVDELLEAIWTPPSEPEKNSSHTATVFGPLKAAKACAYIPD